MSDDTELKEILKEILKWTKFEGMQKVKQILETELDTDLRKMVYELSDGLSSPEIAQIAKIDPSTIRDYWKDWAVLGIVEIHPEYKKRYRRLFSLKEVGIKVPPIKETPKANQIPTTKEEILPGENDE